MAHHWSLFFFLITESLEDFLSAAQAVIDDVPCLGSASQIITQTQLSHPCCAAGPGSWRGLDHHDPHSGAEQCQVRVLSCPDRGHLAAQQDPGAGWHRDRGGLRSSGVSLLPLHLQLQDRQPSLLWEAFPTVPPWNSTSRLQGSSCR